MFCRSLRTRPDLQALVPFLVSSTDPQLRESNLRTHNFAIQVPSRNQQQGTTFRLLILTAASIDESSRADTLARIGHFSVLTAGTSIAISFLCSRSNDSSRGVTVGLQGFSTLQLLLLQDTSIPPIPLLPIATEAEFLPTIKSYISSLTEYLNIPPPIPPARTALSLLPHITSGAPEHPLSEHDTNVLSDICRSISDVATLAETDRGREALRQWMGEAGEGVIEFWGVERSV